MTTTTDVERTVTTQAELDKAIADGVEYIEIRSEAGVWLDVSGSASVRASGSASVRASGSASVRAFDSASVSASGSASVSAFDSASVSAFGSASVSAFGSASVSAFDSASVSAFGSASVSAFDSASVSASGSASVRAFDSASVRASGSASVRASSHVAVHLHSGRATIDGGVVIDHTQVDETDPAIWCAYHGVEVVDGIATVYKAVNDQWTTDRGTDYSPGSTPDCPDWRADNECGGGLHFGPTPVHSEEYYSGTRRYVAVGVRVDELRPIVGGTAKCKAPRVVRPAVEVDVYGRVVAAAVA